MPAQTLAQLQLTIASAIVLVPNDLAPGHCFAGSTLVLDTLAQALLFGGIRVAIYAVEFDHAVVLVVPTTLDKECRRKVSARSLYVGVGNVTLTQ